MFHLRSEEVSLSLTALALSKPTHRLLPRNRPLFLGNNPGNTNSAICHVPSLDFWGETCLVVFVNSRILFLQEYLLEWPPVLFRKPTPGTPRHENMGPENIKHKTPTPQPPNPKPQTLNAKTQTLDPKRKQGSVSGLPPKKDASAASATKEVPP